MSNECDECRLSLLLFAALSVSVGASLLEFRCGRFVHRSSSTIQPFMSMTFENEKGRTDLSHQMRPLSASENPSFKHRTEAEYLEVSIS